MIIISCVTDVCAGVALMHEPQESELMSVPPRDIKTVRLVTPPLIFYSYFFYGTLESVASFVLFFSYMAKRGPTGLMPDSLPSDDDGAPAFAMGYTPKQLTNAWNWGSPTGNLGADEVLALNTASSIFFVSLVAGQFFHLLSVRRSQSPYFSEVKGATPLEWLANAAATVQPRANILLAWLAAVVTAVLFTEVPWLQAVCQTGSVPALYWVYAFLFSFGVFCAGEARKWLIHLSPEGGLVRRLVVW